MHREEALDLLKKIQDKDLRSIAQEYVDKNELTIWKAGKLQKGWAGHVIERYLGLPLNSAQSPNFGSWELKVVPLKIRKDGVLAVKETMAITMIDPINVVQKNFEDSHLFSKLQKMVICARVFESKKENRSVLKSVATFDLNDLNILQRLKADYELVQSVIRGQGFAALSGRLGDLVQPRTKGRGHGSTSRAFYARPHFVSYILGIGDLRPEGWNDNP